MSDPQTTESRHRGSKRGMKRTLKECVRVRDAQRVQLRATAWDVVDGVMFLLALTSVLGAVAVLITFADALWHW